MSIVTITVNPPDNAGRYSLHHYPRRCGDIVVYRAKPPKPEVPGLVREVVWTAVGVQAGQMLEIREKGRSQSTGHFQNLPFTLGPPNYTARSGRAVKGPPAGVGQVAWSYEILLLDGSRKELAIIDPEVIIIDDP